MEISVITAVIAVGAAFGSASASVGGFVVLLRQQNGKIEKKLEAAACGLLHGQVVKDLKKGSHMFEAISKQNLETAERLTAVETKIDGLPNAIKVAIHDAE